MQHLDYTFELKSASEAGAIAGLASTPALDLSGDRVLPGAFAKSIANVGPERPLPMLWSHNVAEPIGAWSRAQETPRGLEVAGALNLETMRGRETHALVKQRAVQGLSIGYSVAKNGATFKDGVRTIKEADLWEVSLVTFPMNEQARVERVKARESKADLEKILRDAGLSRREAKALLSGGWAALNHDPEDNLAALLARATADLKQTNAPTGSQWTTGPVDFSIRGF